MTCARISQAFPTFNRATSSFDIFDAVDSLSEPLAKARALVEIALSDHFLEAAPTIKFSYLSVLDDVLEGLENAQKELVKPT